MKRRAVIGRQAGRVEPLERRLALAGPGLEWSTFLSCDSPYATTTTVTAVQAVRDGSGDVILAGSTRSPDFPLAAGQVHVPGDRMFIARLAARGTAVRWVTFLAGTDAPRGEGSQAFPKAALALDAAGGGVLAGSSAPVDFPVTPGAFDTTHNGLDEGFVTRFDAQGRVVFSTFLGGRGNDVPAGVALDAAGNVVVAGTTSSADFPTNPGAYDTDYAESIPDPRIYSPDDAFVVRLDPTGSRVTYGTYLGGQGNDALSDLVVGADGVITAVGAVTEIDGGERFPTTADALDRTAEPSTVGASGLDYFSPDVVIVRLRPDGNGAADLKYSTYFGGVGGEAASALAADPSDPALFTLAGTTTDHEFPTTVGALRRRRSPTAAASSPPTPSSPACACRPPAAGSSSGQPSSAAPSTPPAPTSSSKATATCC